MYFKEESKRILPYTRTITKKEGDIEFQLIYPGKEDSDFEVEIRDKNLFVQASSFKSLFYIPEGTDYNKISAKYEAGILKVLLPKKPKKKPIKIKVG